MDHSNHPRLSPDELTDAVLTGAPVYGPDNSQVGTISHVHGSGEDASVVIDVGGFLGIGAKPVALSLRAIDAMRGETGEVHALVTMTKDELKDLPEHHD